MGIKIGGCLCVCQWREAARAHAQLCAWREHPAKMVYDTQNIKYNTIGLICSRKVTCGVVNNLLTLEYVTLRGRELIWNLLKFQILMLVKI